MPFGGDPLTYAIGAIIIAAIIATFWLAGKQDWREALDEERRTGRQSLPAAGEARHAASPSCDIARHGESL